MDTLYKFVKKANKQFWPGLLDPGPPSTEQVVQIRPGSVEQMQGTLYYLYDAWVETPGAIEVIREKKGERTYLINISIS